MKKMILVAFSALALTACGGQTAPSVSVTGSYNGTFTYQGQILPSFTFTLNQTNTPNNGDFSGTVTKPNFLPSTVAGNVYSGILNITDPASAAGAGTATCNGKWADATRYDGTCTLRSSAGNFNNVALTLTKA